MIVGYLGKKPILDPSVYVAEGAHIIGDVAIGRNSSVWYNAVIRGDVNSIEIGERTNVQDNVVIHVTRNKWSTFVACDVTIGHGAIIHGCVVEEACLIGMGAILLDGSRIGMNSLVAAGAVVREGMVVPPRSFIAGVPANVVRSLTDQEIQKIKDSAQHYVDYASVFRKGESV